MEQSPLTRVKRQGPVDPKQYLDEEINHLIKTLPDSIDNAKERIQDSQFFKVNYVSSVVIKSDTSSVRTYFV